VIEQLAGADGLKFGKTRRCGGEGYVVLVAVHFSAAIARLDREYEGVSGVRIVSWMITVLHLAPSLRAKRSNPGCRRGKDSALFCLVSCGFTRRINRATIAALISPKNDLVLAGPGRRCGNVLKTKIREIACLA
jgi:hypothetical protein